jgi:hypothetical protein
MKNKVLKSTVKTAAEAAKPSTVPTAPPDTLPEEAFLQDAEKEPKRILLADHTKTIRKLRDEKRLTFRAIAEWFGERGLDTDQSAVYRAYCASFPEVDQDGYPIEKEVADVVEADTIDEFQNATLKNRKVEGVK